MKDFSRVIIMSAAAFLLCAAALVWVIGEKGGKGDGQRDTAVPWEGVTYEIETD